MVWKCSVLSEKGKPLTFKFQLLIFHTSVMAKKPLVWITIKRNIAYAFMKLHNYAWYKPSSYKNYTYGMFVVACFPLKKIKGPVNHKAEIIFRHIIHGRNTSYKKWTKNPMSKKTVVKYSRQFLKLGTIRVNLCYWYNTFMSKSLYK